MNFYESTEVHIDDFNFDIEKIIANIKTKFGKKNDEVDGIYSSIEFNMKYRNQLCGEDFDRIMERLRTEMRVCGNCIDLLNEQLEVCMDIQLRLQPPEPYLDVLLEHDHEAKSAYGSYHAQHRRRK